MATLGFQDYKIPVLEGKYHYVTSGFGPREVNGKPGTHIGIDVVGKNDTPDYIVAFASGVVTTVSENSSMGVHVVIQHSGDIRTRYLHLKKGSVEVSAGDHVVAGQRLAYMGNTGNVSPRPLNANDLKRGRHLHFDLTYKGKYVDPGVYLFGTEVSPPSITKITQLSSTKVQIEGVTVGGALYDSLTRCYYRWGDDLSVSEGRFDGYFDEVSTFATVIDKPRTANFISVIPIRISPYSDGLEGVMVQHSLDVSYPCVRISTSEGNSVDAVPHIYIGGEWRDVIPTIGNKNDWYNLYNTDAERVK